MRRESKGWEQRAHANHIRRWATDMTRGNTGVALGRGFAMVPALQPSDVKLIRTFVTVADAGGLSAAQVKLNRSLTAISSDLQVLETRLGSRLCQRGRSGFSLTEFGQQVYNASRGLFEALGRFQLEILPAKDHLKGDLRIAVNEGQINDPDFMLSEAIARFRGRPKNMVKVSVAMTSYEQTLESVLNDEVDIGFGFFRLDHPRIERFPLYQERNLLYCGRGHPLFDVRDEDLTVERIVEQPFVLRALHPGNHYPAALAGITAASLGKTPESRAYLILSGNYLGYLGDHHGDRWVKAGLMRPLLPEQLQFTMTMEAVAKRTAARPQHIGLFLLDYFAASHDRSTRALSEPAAANGKSAARSAASGQRGRASARRR